MATNHKRRIWIVLGAVVAIVAIHTSWFVFQGPWAVDTEITGEQSVIAQPSGSASLDGIVSIERQREIATADTSVSSADVVSLVIGGYDIPRAEFEYALDAVRNDVVLQFADDGESVGSEFWLSVEADSPTFAAAQAAVAWLKERYATYIVAVEAGLVESASWDALSARLATTNAGRASAIDRGEVVYGLPQYDVKTFVEYEESSFFEAFTVDESLPNMALSEEEIETFFASHDWELADGSIPTLADVRANVVREARGQRYKAMLALQQSQILFDVDADELAGVAAQYLGA